MEFNNINPIGENVVTINCNLFPSFCFSELLKIKFKMKFQSSFCLEFFQMLAKHDFLYLSLHLLKWNESKLSMFIKIYTIRNFKIFFLKYNLRKFSSLAILVAFHLKSKKLYNSFNIYWNLMRIFF